jgi:L-threonylcarbamoyladenylate synthase
MVLDGSQAQAISQAAQALAAGQLVGLPTETVYGLAADAEQSQAVAAIFSTKGRPSDHPLIVHIARPEQAAHFASSIPDFAQALMDAFWPGPLTLILPRRDGVASAAAGHQASIGLRCPAHPVAHALLSACEALGIHGLAAPSANRFGRVSPTTAAHVQQEFGCDLLVLDGGACQVGIESTIVDCTRGQPVVLRPGHILAEQIEQIAGKAQALAQSAPKASGTLESHYAPQAPVRLMDARTLQTALEVLGKESPRLVVYARSPLRSTSPHVRIWPMPGSATQAAQELFAALRAFDEQGAQLIWVETPPPEPAWDGVADRLRRAAFTKAK